MHYCCLVITKEFPTDNVLSGSLAPFNDSVYYSNTENKESKGRPAFLWDWWQVGGRYNGLLKMNFPAESIPHKTPCNKKDFRSFVIDKIEGYVFGTKDHFFFDSEYQIFYGSMGFRDGFLYVDGASISDILNLESVGCYCCVDADGNGYARESWNGEKWIENDTFDDEVNEVIANSKDYYACIVDIHD